MPLPRNSVCEDVMFLGCPVRPFVYPFVWSDIVNMILYLMNGLSSFDEADGIFTSPYW